jgi:hypothetical protein
MEQSGFRPGQPQAYQGANYGWRGVLCGPGAGLGADRLKSAGTIQS